MAVLIKKLKGVDMESLSNSATHLRGSGDYFDGQDQHHIYQEIFTPPSVSHHQRQDYMSLEEIRSSQNASGNKLKKWPMMPTSIARTKTSLVKYSVLV